MPLIHVSTNLNYSDDQATEFTKSAARIGAKALDKTEDYMMVNLQRVDGYFFSSDKAMALIEVRSLGFKNHSTALLQESLSDLTKDVFGIDPGRLYFNFFSLTREQWKWNF